MRSSLVAGTLRLVVRVRSSVLNQERHLHKVLSNRLSYEPTLPSNKTVLTRQLPGLSYVRQRQLRTTQQYLNTENKLENDEFGYTLDEYEEFLTSCIKRDVKKMMSRELEELADEIALMAVKLRTDDTLNRSDELAAEVSMNLPGFPESESNDPEVHREHDLDCVKGYLKSIRCEDVDVLEVGRQVEKAKTSRDIVFKVNASKRTEIMTSMANYSDKKTPKLFVRDPIDQLSYRMLKREEEIRFILIEKHGASSMYWHRFNGSLRADIMDKFKDDVKYLQRFVTSLNKRSKRLNLLRFDLRGERELDQRSKKLVRFITTDRSLPKKETINLALHYFNVDPAEVKLSLEPQEIDHLGNIETSYVAEFRDSEEARKVMTMKRRLLNAPEEDVTKLKPVRYYTDVYQFIDNIKIQEVDLRNVIAAMDGVKPDWYLSNGFVKRHSDNPGRRRKY